MTDKMSKTEIKMEKPLDFAATIVEKEQLAPAIWSMTLEPEEREIDAVPGQFFMIKSWKTRDPFLSRPFAASGVHADGTIEVLFRVCGRGTALLAECKKGQNMLLRGPCGNGFPKPESKRLVLAAGAMGVAPLLFARQRLHGFKDLLLLVGTSGEPEWEPFCEAIRARCPETAIFSENGAIGDKGSVIDGLRGLVCRKDEIWACGPEGMLRALGGAQAGLRHSIWISLERRMACGYGGCLGCTVQTRNGPKRACVDGPVFRWEEILWDELS
ncbi:MAG: dihydroorotate dehydrogenase electron transfer subunit [Thermovirgaceae bacterium]